MSEADSTSETLVMSAGQLARQRSSSAGTRPPLRSATPIDPRVTDVDFEACAATASYFIYTQGATIVCLHHDSLAIERRFDGGKDGHEEPIVFLCADNVSERGAGRLVVSYDTAKVAIVWDLFTGQQVARFGSYYIIGAAAWMRNGNIAFGETRNVCWKIFRVLTCMPQGTRRAASFYSNRRTPSIYQRAPSMTRLPL